MEVNMGRRGHGLSARGGSAAATSDVLAASSASLGDEDVDLDNDDYTDNDDNNYEDNASDSNANDNNNNEALGEADAPPEDTNLRWVHMLASVVPTNQYYGLGLMVTLPDASTAVPAAFNVMELQAPICFPSLSLAPAGGFSEEDLLICFCCLGWILTALLSRCNCDG
jgi:hypothetical protein